METEKYPWWWWWECQEGSREVAPVESPLVDLVEQPWTTQPD